MADKLQHQTVDYQKKAWFQNWHVNQSISFIINNNPVVGHRCTSGTKILRVILRAYHFLSSDSNGFRVFHHTGLVIHKWALRFGWCTFIQLRKNTHINTQLNCHCIFFILGTIGLSFAKGTNIFKREGNQFFSSLTCNGTLHLIYPSIIPILSGVQASANRL